MATLEEMPAPPPMWRRVPLRETFILTESPSTAYDRVMVNEATFRVDGPSDFSEPGHVFEVLGARYLEHYEGAVRDLVGATRRRFLEWAPIVVLMAEIIDAPKEPDRGHVVWILMDDLAEQDKIHVWNAVHQALGLTRPDGPDLPHL